jgi:hypothetical protein
MVNNAKGDVDYVLQEIRKEGVDVRRDKGQLAPGQHTWDQIGQFIDDPALSDAFIIVVTTESLKSKSCREEPAYAVTRALQSRGGTYPIIGLVRGEVPTDMPPVLKARLWVSTDEKHWAQRVASGVRREAPGELENEILPFEWKLASGTAANGADHVFSVWPRVGSWSPFVYGVPLDVADALPGGASVCPPDEPEAICAICTTGEWTENGIFWRDVTSRRGQWEPIANLGNVHDLRAPWRSSTAWTALDEYISGPCLVSLYGSVLQTNPATRPAAVIPSPLIAAGIPPEEAFIPISFGLRKRRKRRGLSASTATLAGCLCCLGGCRGSDARQAGPPRIGTGRTSVRPAMLGAALRGSARRTPRRSESSLPARAGSAPV